MDLANCLNDDVKANLSQLPHFIFTPTCEITPNEITQVLRSGGKAINVDLGYGTIEDNQRLIRHINSALEDYKNESKFNIPVPKLCTIRGRIPSTGRMRNCCEWNLCRGEEIVLTSCKPYQFCSTNQVCFVSNFHRVISQLKPGDIIQIGSEVVLNVAKITSNCYITCCVRESGKLESYQKLTLSCVVQDSLEPSVEEIEDCEFIKQNDFDFVIVPSVCRPEYFHTLSKQLAGSNNKMIADVDEKAADTTVIDKIIEHFYGVYVNEATDDYVIRKAREIKKLIIAKLSSEDCLGPRTKEICTNSDSLLLEATGCTCDVNEISEKLLKELKNLNMTTETIADSETNEMLRNQEAKAIVCVNQTEQNSILIASSRPPCAIIQIIRSPSIAKRLQLWRNVIAIVYDGEGKTEQSQREEMMQIVKIYGESIGLFKDEDQFTCMDQLQ